MQYFFLMRQTDRFIRTVLSQPLRHQQDYFLKYIFLAVFQTSHNHRTEKKL